MSPPLTRSQIPFLRLHLLIAGMAATGILLVAMLWRIQVARGPRYEHDLALQSLRRIRVPGMRGRMFDRHGMALADNRPSYAVALYLEELRLAGRRSSTEIEALVKELSERLQLPPTLTRQDILTHQRLRLPLPLVAWRNLDDAALARWAERAADLPGVGLLIEAERMYPQGALAGHTLGYVGRADPVQDGDQPYHYHLPEMEGRRGLERQFDALLRGQPGGRLVRVDVAGFRHDDLGVRAPEAGADLLLTLDHRIQALAEEALAGQVGAAVVLDPRNGDVLALASAPGFDPNLFVPRVSAALWRELLADEDKPLIHRAAAGQYPPGSTFKPVVALAGLELAGQRPATRYDCPGYIQMGRRRFACWYHAGHGSLDMRQSLQHSCNVYYYRLALEIGPEPIVRMAERLGLGARTGIELDYEAPGLLPSPTWKRETQGDAWREGDTCNFSIGQGALTVTPLQMAALTAAIANGGRLYRPRLVQGIRAPEAERFVEQPIELSRRMAWTPAHLDIIRGGMRDVVMAPRGTGRLAAIPGIPAAGKTGTAQYGRLEAGLKYGWMIAYIPAEHPRYAVAIVVDRALSGGSTVAPLMRRLFEGLFALHPTGEAG
ncbi:MAG: penicillin-binding protein 2 [Candidatus Marinimicrobia bacterium]|nr:penicillin-binding protein 2 [Candidatus Neomarinimicrobiota bacterium]